MQLSRQATQRRRASVLLAIDLALPDACRNSARPPESCSPQPDDCRAGLAVAPCRAVGGAGGAQPLPELPALGEVGGRRPVAGQRAPAGRSRSCARSRRDPAYLA
ncbi:MAG: hypothetical protein MZW92_35455 [Comamonadaceae bacterium]|nr:hypothetical protein [Comamonadaceae bacterium]